MEYISQYGDDWSKWQEINICATYIKRYSNLVFLNEYSNGISWEDMRIAIKESLNNLKRMGINEGLKIDSYGISGGTSGAEAFDNLPKAIAIINQRGLLVFPKNQKIYDDNYTFR